MFVFFPAVTGIWRGRACRRTASAHQSSGNAGNGVCHCDHLYTQAIFLGGSVARDELVHTEMVMSEIAILPLLIVAGVIAATMSSALGSMMGAPRILQSMARDRVVPSLEKLGVLSGKKREPRRAIAVTFLISQAGILAADLNTIAR